MRLWDLGDGDIVCSRSYEMRAECTHILIIVFLCDAHNRTACKHLIGSLACIRGCLSLPSRTRTAFGCLCGNFAWGARVPDGAWSVRFSSSAGPIASRWPVSDRRWRCRRCLGCPLRSQPLSWRSDAVSLSRHHHRLCDAFPLRLCIGAS